jgi:hypothetical protein
VQEAAELWAGGLEREGTRAQLELPVVAGIRRGWQDGTVTAEAKAEGTQLRFDLEPIDYRVHTPAFVVLLLGAIGGLSVLALPFFPSLLPALPLSLILLLLAWFLVVSKIRHRSFHDFEKLLQDLAEEPTETPTGEALLEH